MSSINLKINLIVVLDDEVAIKWKDGSESFINNKILREACPCAHCSGESDIFGNVYIGEKSEHQNINQYKIMKYISVGHYAIRFFWADNHNSGIYPYKLLKSL